MSADKVSQLSSHQLENLSLAERQAVLQMQHLLQGRSAPKTNKQFDFKVPARVKCELLQTFIQILRKASISKLSGSHASQQKLTEPEEQAANNIIDFMVLHTQLASVLVHLIGDKTGRQDTKDVIGSNDNVEQAEDKSRNEQWDAEVRVLALECLKTLAQAINSREGVFLGEGEVHKAAQLMEKKKAVAPFKWMNSCEIIQLAELCSMQMFQHGDVVQCQGSWARRMFIVLSGSLTVTCRTKGRLRDTICSTLSEGHLWGEKALLFGEISNFTITAESTSCALLVVTRESIRRFLPSNPSLHLQICQEVDGVCGTV